LDYGDFQVLHGGVDLAAKKRNDQVNLKTKFFFLGGFSPVVYSRRRQTLKPVPKQDSLLFQWLLSKCQDILDL
jgi:hypothetical protein